MTATERQAIRTTLSLLVAIPVSSPCLQAGLSPGLSTWAEEGGSMGQIAALFKELQKRIFYFPSSTPPHFWGPLVGMNWCNPNPALCSFRSDQSGCVPSHSPGLQGQESGRLGVGSRCPCLIWGFYPHHSHSVSSPSLVRAPKMALFLLGSPLDRAQSPVVVGMETASQRKHSFVGVPAYWMLSLSHQLN